MSTAFLFPGQASQHVGMGLALYEQAPAARAVFDQADEQLGYSLSTLCFHGPLEALTDTAVQQPAIYVTSVAAWQAIMAAAWAVPTFVAGHSLGEFSALTAAGSLPFADGLQLVQRRGQLMKSAGEQAPGGMAAILALDIDTMADICRQATAMTGNPVQVANDNCPGQVVISGYNDSLEKAMALAKEAGARKVVRLPVSIAAHSPLMASITADFSALIDIMPITDPQLPVIGNVNAAPLTTASAIRDEVKAQLTSAVRWTESMNYLVAAGVDTVVEVGPGDVLLSLMKRIHRQTARQKFELT